MCKKPLWIVLALSAILLAPGAAFAELQNVEVGGSIEIFGNYYTPFYEVNTQTRVPAFLMPFRPIGPFGATSGIRSDKDGNSNAWVEQRTAINVKADFTNNVCAFIELDSIDVWGEDFRSNYITGADAVTPTNDDLEVYQAYIQVEELFDMPLRLRMGRQEIILGNGWLVGNNPAWDPLTYLSFDAIRLTYETETVTIDAFWAKLADTSPAEEDGDTDLYGIFATCRAMDPVMIDAYWLFLRDARSIQNTNFIAPLEHLEELFDVDGYDPTTIHTIGMRVYGETNGFDFDLEAAYQFGNAATAGSGFIPFPFLYGDDDAEYRNWAGHIELGYTIDMAWNPRVYIGAEYYGGRDDRDISRSDFRNPFDIPDASISFNRMFSDWESDWFLDGGALSNAWVGKAGVSVSPTEKLEAGLDLRYYETLDGFRQPYSGKVGQFYIPVLPFLFPYFDQGGDFELGFETSIWATYAYSEDLNFEIGWSHFFNADGMDKGAFSDANGLALFRGRDTKDGDYMYLGTTISF